MLMGVILAFVPLILAGIAWWLWGSLGALGVVIVFAVIGAIATGGR